VSCDFINISESGLGLIKDIDGSGNSGRLPFKFTAGHKTKEFGDN